MNLKTNLIAAIAVCIFSLSMMGCGDPDEQYRPDPDKIPKIPKKGSVEDGGNHRFPGNGSEEGNMDHLR